MWIFYILHKYLLYLLSFLFRVQLSDKGSLTADELSQNIGISVTLAKQRWVLNNMQIVDILSYL